MDRKALVYATGVGLVLQVLMVLTGHYLPAVKALFAAGGMGLSLVAGVLYAERARASWKSDLAGGAIAGGVCALIGIAISVILGDVPPGLLLLGTAFSVITGLVGGGLGKMAFP
jgi:hypothetical protein